MKQSYIILSKGEYSDYNPTYYAATTENPITHLGLEQLERQSTIEAYKQCEALETRPHEHSEKCHDSIFTCKQSIETLDPEGNQWYVREPKHLAPDFFWDILKEKIEQRGYTPLPAEIPEINISYSDLNYTPEGKLIDQWWH
jgi:hypothetical protein